MLTLAQHTPGDLGGGYVQLLDEAPFHIGAGAYTNVGWINLGFPNLDDPRKTKGPFPTNYRAWAGDYGDGPHQNSTLLAGPCKLLVTGGKNPSYSNVVVPGNPDEVSLGYQNGLVDRDAGFARLAQLIVAAIAAGKVNDGLTFEELRAGLADQANLLGAASWGVSGAGERVFRAFAAYGFGRDKESEPNAALSFGSSAAAKNLIGVGQKRQRSIGGAVCSSTDAEDTFVLNEQLKTSQFEENADRIQFNALSTAIDVRFYRGQPCPEEYPAALRPCARDHQLFPPVNPSTGVWSGSASFGNFPALAATGGAPPPGGTGPWRDIYVVVRPTAANVCGLTQYTLNVNVTHKESFY